LKAQGATAACVFLGVSLGGCEVYDQKLVAPRLPAQIALADSGARQPADVALAADAGTPRPRATSTPIGVDAGRGRAAASPNRGDVNDLNDMEDAGVTERADASRVEPPAADSSAIVDAAQAPDTCTVDCGYGWRRRLIIDGSQVSEPLSDFPVLVRLSDAHLAANAAAGGEDLYFTADDGLTLLDFEIEHYDVQDEHGELVAWVRVPSLDAGVDTTIYFGYGDGKSGRSKASAVWSDFHNVWHLSQDPSAGDSALRDSTERAHGTAHSSMTAQASVSGLAGRALDFDGVDDEVTFFNDLWGSGPSTFSGWVKQVGSLGEYGTAMISVGDGTVDRSARFMLSHADDGRVKCGFMGDDDLTTAVLPLDEWKYLSWTWDGRESAVYIDAVRVLGPASHTQVATAGLTGKLGSSSFRFEYFMFGQLDELHISTSARSSAWISAEYANQRPASTFIKLVSEPEPGVAH
jgi:hypothetical protein